MKEKRLNADTAKRTMLTKRKAKELRTIAANNAKLTHVEKLNGNR
jgi:hypothetical protein